MRKPIKAALASACAIACLAGGAGGAAAQPPFDPDLDVNPSTPKADSPSGLGVDLWIPQNNDPDGQAAAHLRDAIIELPPGFTVSPAGGHGLEGCTNEQIGLVDPNVDPPQFTDTPASCPPGSVLGTVDVYSPVLPAEVPGEANLKGVVYLGTPLSTNPTSGEMFRVFMTAAGRGVRVKLYGFAVADPHTGQLTTTFYNNPQLPFSHLWLSLKSGPDAPFATPMTCGAFPIRSTFVARTEKVVRLSRDMLIDQACGLLPFTPEMVAGVQSPQAKTATPLRLSFGRDDGEPEVGSVSVQTPQGLLGSLRGVARCPEAAAQAGTCPPESRIGSVKVGAGAGPTPYFVDGTVSLTGPYNNARAAAGHPGGTHPAPFGLAVAVRAVAGPYDLGMVVVRQSIRFDPETADLSVVSDPVPRILAGVPLRIRRIDVDIDRPNFMVTPTSCDPASIRSRLVSTTGAVSDLQSRFQVGGCADLPFAPKLAMELTRRREIRPGRHPGLKATVTQAPGQANIGGARVELPLSLALDPDNARALCEFEDGRKPEPTCPPGSIVGSATTHTPLLDKPLKGPVYFVKNVRIDPRTGNAIRTLPTIIVALRGEISINLRANTESVGGKLVNTFETIPDAPISRFELSIEGGSKGILAVTGGRSLCAPATAMERFSDGPNPLRRTDAFFTGQNGKRTVQKINMKTPCKKPSRLRLRRARIAGKRLVVRGRVARVAAKRVKVVARCGRTRLAKRAKVNSKGMFKARLKLRGRCADAKRVRVAARYPGDRKLESGSSRRVARR
jgi:hypothetical protein